MTAFTRLRFATREEWLGALIEALRPHFAAAGYPIPEHLRVACGWPKADGIRHTKAVGTTWGGAADGVLQIFVSPVLSDIVVQADGSGVAPTLVHELVHAAAGLEVKHGTPFKRLGAAVGLEPPWTATTASAGLCARLEQLCAALGAYPHSPLGEPQHKQSTRQKKLVCRTCGYTVRASQQWIDRGFPFCNDGDPLEPGSVSREAPGIARLRADYQARLASPDPVEAEVARVQLERLNMGKTRLGRAAALRKRPAAASGTERPAAEFIRPWRAKLQSLLTAAGNPPLRWRSQHVYECGHSPYHTSRSGAPVLVDLVAGSFWCRSCDQRGGSAEVVSRWKGLPINAARRLLDARFGNGAPKPEDLEVRDD